jgi:hypothetical protein
MFLPGFVPVAKGRMVSSFIGLVSVTNSGKILDVKL